MNRATKINVTAMGILFGISGIIHGVAETLQGNTPTNGLIINAIAAGSPWSRWTEGGEAAFTLIPNFLLTGSLAIAVGVAIIVWSLGYVHKAYGPLVYLLLFVLLFLVGGGIGQVIFFIPAWAVATRIHKPLTWWRRVLSPGLRKGGARAWRGLLITPLVLMTLAIFFAVFGYMPGMTAMEQVLNMTLAIVAVAWLLFLLAFVAGFAYDLEQAERVNYVEG